MESRKVLAVVRHAPNPRAFATAHAHAQAKNMWHNFYFCTNATKCIESIYIIMT